MFGSHMESPKIKDFKLSVRNHTPSMNKLTKHKFLQQPYHTFPYQMWSLKLSKFYRWYFVLDCSYLGKWNLSHVSLSFLQPIDVGAWCLNRILVGTDKWLTSAPCGPLGGRHCGPAENTAGHFTRYFCSPPPQDSNCANYCRVDTN